MYLLQRHSETCFFVTLPQTCHCSSHVITTSQGLDSFANQVLHYTGRQSKSLDWQSQGTMLPITTGVDLPSVCSEKTEGSSDWCPTHHHQEDPTQEQHYPLSNIAV